MKRNIIKKISTILIIFLILFILIPIYSNATIDPGEWKPSDLTSSQDIKEITDRAGVIVGALRVGGVVVCVIALMIIGIKYMTGSVGEKADYKKAMVPYLLGVFFVFTLSQILAVIIDVVGNID